MSELNFDKDEQPVLKVVKGGKTHEIRPVEFLRKVEEKLGQKAFSKKLRISEVTSAVREASGIKSLGDDDAARLQSAAQELLLRMQLSKKKLLSALGFSGSTPASADSPGSTD